MWRKIGVVRMNKQDIEKAWQPLPEPLPEPYKELATDNNVVTKSGKDNNVLTIGDKIRESNESLVEWYANRVNLYVCGESVTVNPLNKEKCLNYLNQPYTDTTN